MKDKLKHILVAIEALRLLHHSLHLSATCYSLHLLFQRLYEPLVGEFDKLAEHFVRLGGEVDPCWIADQTSPLLRRWEEGEPCDRALRAENDLAALLSRVIKSSGSELAVDNSLRGMIDAHATHIYLLQQQEKGEHEEHEEHKE